MTALIDEYTLYARIYPSILTLLPILVLTLCTSPSTLKYDFAKNSLLLVVGLALFAFNAQLARQMGKKIETELLRSWGGWPTTTILRYADSSIDDYTKTRYHAAMRKLCPEILWPTREDEEKNPIDCDKRYASAVKTLLERRRDKAYRLIHAENRSYGFRRNLLGLKPIAISLAIIFATSEVVFALIQIWSNHEPIALNSHDLPYLIGACLDLLLVAVWLRFVDYSFVEESARDYARALFRSLDEQTLPI